MIYKNIEDLYMRIRELESEVFDLQEKLNLAEQMIPFRSQEDYQNMKDKLKNEQSNN